MKQGWHQIGETIRFGVMLRSWKCPLGRGELLPDSGDALIASSAPISSNWMMSDVTPLADLVAAYKASQRG